MTDTREGLLLDYRLAPEERHLVVWALQCLLLVTAEGAHTRDDLRRAGALLVRLNRPDPPDALEDIRCPTDPAS